MINDGAAVYTPGISERRSGVSKWSHQDYLGSTKALTNSSETVTDTRQYDAFGLQTGSTGSNPTPFGFAGGWGYQSDETGLQLLGHRYYDPSTGRFLTRDPIKDGRNWYGYCDNNPIRLVDPNGLDKIVIVRGNQTDPDDISKLTDNIISDYQREHPKDTIVVVDNADEALKELSDADALIWIGHYDPPRSGPWDPILASFDCEDGSRLDPEDISRRRRGKRLKWIHLVGCNTLSNEGIAAAWARLCNGNLWGFYGLVAINYYAHGLVGLQPYKKGNSQKSKTWWGGRKKYGYPRGTTRA